MIIDSHCHLNHVKSKLSLDDVITNAKNNSINVILNISTKKSEFDEIIEISETYPEVYFTLGIHPHEAGEMNKDVAMNIKKHANNNKFIGIGETGLDFFYNHEDKKTQMNAFESQIEIAQDLSLPITVHMRDAEKETLEVITKKAKEKDLNGVIHCFTGSKKFSEEMIDLGFYISASGIITFKKSEELRSIFKDIPGTKLLVETDSPYLSPEPLRGKVNQPANLVHTINKLAEIRKSTEEQIINMTNTNFHNLFKRIDQN